MVQRRSMPFSSLIGGGPALLPMDVAFEYLRDCTWRVVPPFLVAIGPYSVAVFMVIDVAVSQHRAAVAETCGLLTLATIWRWAWLAVVQRRVQTDLSGEAPKPLRRCLVAIVLVRLFACVAVVWGGLLIIPAFYGFFLSGLVAPMMLERDGRAWTHTRRTLVWIHKATGRLSKVTWALLVLLLLAAVSIVALQLLLVKMLLPSVFGLDTADLTLTVESRSWMLCLLYFLFVIFDLYWVVLSVVLYYDLQSRHMGTDLRSRLLGLAEGVP